MQEVQCQLSLREEAIPKVKRKVFVGTTKAGNKMVLKGTNGMLGGIAVMYMRWDQLEIHILSH